METLQENSNFIVFIWYSIFTAASVMAVLLPLYLWKHFWLQGGVLISKMKLGFHGLWNTLSPWRYNTSLALYVKHFNIQYAWALAQNSNFHLLWLMYYVIME